MKKTFMDSNTHHNFLHQQHQNHQPNSGLLRFRSAPSSLLVNFTEEGDCGGVNKNSSCDGIESERLFSRFVNYSGTNDSVSSPSFQEFDDKSTVMAAENRMNSQQQGYTGLPPHYPRHASNTSASAMESGSFGLVNSMTMDRHTQAKTVNSNLARQNSTPAGLFSQISVQNGIVLCPLSSFYSHVVVLFL